MLRPFHARNTFTHLSFLHAFRLVQDVSFLFDPFSARATLVFEIGNCSGAIATHGDQQN